MTAALKGLLKQNCTPFYKPVESIEMINNVLFEILTDGKYLTACYGKLNRKAKTMTIVNAGHLPAIHLPKQGPAVLIEMEGDVLLMKEKGRNPEDDVILALREGLTNAVVEGSDLDARLFPPACIAFRNCTKSLSRVGLEMPKLTKT